MQYSSAMTALKAEQALLDIQTSNFRAYKKQDKTKILNHLKRKAHGLIKRHFGAVPTYGEVMKDLRSKLSGGR